MKYSKRMDLSINTDKNKRNITKTFVYRLLPLVTRRPVHLDWSPFLLSFHGAESCFRSYESLGYSRNSSPFVEPKVSLPCSQEPTESLHKIP